MRKLVLLVGLCLLGVLMFGAVAGAENHDATPGPVEPLTAGPEATTPADDQYTPGPVEPLTALPEATTPTDDQYGPDDPTGGMGVLPETGGLVGAISLATLVLLVGGGLFSARFIRR